MAVQRFLHEMEHRSFGDPDETREFPHGRAEIVSFGDSRIGRMTFAPGRRCSTDVKPSGRLGIGMDDGTEMVAEAGDVTSLPSGHDGWVIGEEPVVVVDWYEASNYAKTSS